MSTFNPSFLLRGVDPDEILQRYLQGGYRTIPQIGEKIHLTKGTSLIKEKITRNEDDALYFISSRSCSDNVICARSGHTDVRNYLRTGSTEICGPCEKCGRDSCMGYPIAYKSVPALIKENGVDVHRNIHCFWTEGRSCCFEHSLELVRQKPCLSSDCVQLVHLLYRLTYPRAPPLKESLDPLLLQKYGGPLSEEDWTRQTYKLTRTSHVILIPAQVEYRNF